MPDTTLHAEAGPLAVSVDAAVHPAISADAAVHPAVSADAAVHPAVFGDVVGQPAAVATLAAAVRAAADGRAIPVAAMPAGETGPLTEPAGPETEAAAVSASTPAAGAMTHAWLFTGPPGSGRSVAARAFAAALSCPHGGCGRCGSCRTVRAGTHADVHVVIPQGLSISVAEMRDIVRTAARVPVVGPFHILIIEDADRLTEAAANALLKAVEEPPLRTVFLLCAPSAHPDDIAVTLRSRCRVVPLRTPRPDAVADVLVRRDGIDPPLAAWAAQASQGHVGRARRLARDEHARERRRAVLAVPGSLPSLAAALRAADALVAAAEAEAAAIAVELDVPERDALAQAMGAGGTGRGTAAATRGSAGALKDLERRQKSRSTRSQRDALDRALVDLAGFYRDVLVRQYDARVPAAHPDAADTVTTVAAMSKEAALVRLEAVLACRAALEQNVKPRIAVEAMVAMLRLPGH